jgi:serine/threonine protein kinase
MPWGWHEHRRGQRHHGYEVAATAMSDAFPELTHFSTRYEVLSKLGEGTTGRVYLVRHRQKQLVAALKVPNLDNPDERRERVPRFLCECRALALLGDDPNIPAIYDCGCISDCYFYTRSFASGATLRKRVEAGSVTLERGVQIIENVARTVHRVHAKGLMHRNLTPDNVIVGDGDAVKLIGFGIAAVNRPPISLPAMVPPTAVLGIPIVNDLQALLGMFNWFCATAGTSLPRRALKRLGQTRIATPREFAEALKGAFG